jgi:hypothetical protein
MRTNSELSRAFHGAARKQDDYDRATEAGLRAVYELGCADTENNDWRDAAKELPDSNNCVEVWGDGRGNTYLASYYSGRWREWISTRGIDDNHLLPFKPTHWRPMRPRPRG